MTVVVATSLVGDDGGLGGLIRCVTASCASNLCLTTPSTLSSQPLASGVWSKDSLVVPNAEDLRQRCLSLHRVTPLAGHLGCDRTGAAVLLVAWSWKGCASINSTACINM